MIKYFKKLSQLVKSIFHFNLSKKISGLQIISKERGFIISFLVDNYTFIVRLEHLNQATLTPKIKELMIKELFEISINDEANFTHLFKVSFQVNFL